METRQPAEARLGPCTRKEIEREFLGYIYIYFGMELDFYFTLILIRFYCVLFFSNLINVFIFYFISLYLSYLFSFFFFHFILLRCGFILQKKIFWMLVYLISIGICRIICYRKVVRVLLTAVF